MCSLQNNWGNNMTSKIHSLILAAGKGTRMKSDLPKVIHPILGQPMVAYVIDRVIDAGSTDVSLVVGYKSSEVKASLGDYNVSYVEQTEQFGTGHAVQCYAKETKNIPESLLVVCGDTPLLSLETLKELLKKHKEHNPAITMMTLDMKEPGNYGRIVRDGDKVIAIREAKDCTDDELEIKEVNLAVYLFNGDFLFDNIFKLKSNNKQGEFYLTDLVEMAAAQGKSVITCKEKDEASTIGINSRIHLEYVSKILKNEINNYHMEKGVTIVDSNQTVIGPKVEIGRDTTIWPGSVIIDKCKIGPNCIIGPNTTIDNSDIGNSVMAKHCYIENAKIEDSSTVPPYSCVCE